MRLIPLYIVNKQIRINQNCCNMARVQRNLRQEIERKKFTSYYCLTSKFRFEFVTREATSTTKQIYLKKLRKILFVYSNCYQFWLIFLCFHLKKSKQDNDFREYSEIK